jgi:hypothetical protein
MDHSLFKGSLLLHVDYAPGGGFSSNNLHGRNFTYCTHMGKPCLRIDMSGNLRVRNKQTNSYLDACQLVEQHLHLNVVSLDRGIVAKFATRAKEADPTEWQLELDFADKNSFGYTITNVSTDEATARFDVAYKWKGIYQSPESRARMTRYF